MAEQSSKKQDAAAECGDANETLLDISCIYGVSKECAAKNAQELIQEEEQEKQRAEKRKARNKKKKEKKKQKQLELNKNINKDSNREINNGNKKSNVSEDDNVTKQKKKERLNGDLPEEKYKESKEEGVSENDAVEDDFLDLNSAFVTNVVHKSKQKSVNIIRQKRTTNIVMETNEESAVDEAEKLGLQGYLAARDQQYEEAVKYFTKAIKLNKNGFRFYSNRSFCYCQLGQYTKGLKDADKAIQCLPDNPKGYFHRGKVLKHLKQYKEAEEAFLKALELDDSFVEAQQELNNLKVQQLVDMGFELHEAQIALQQHWTVQAAVEALSINKDESLEDDDMDEDEIFYSDDEKESLALAANNNIDLSNPLGHTSLWVGNITESVTVFQLVEVFSRYGEIASIKLLPRSFCAFINYKDKSAPGPAMRCLQGIFMGGKNLVIKFPNSTAADTQKKALIVASTKPAETKGPVNSKECHFWRTTGCAFGDKCRYVHIQEHKGIDKKPWQKMTQQ